MSYNNINLIDRLNKNGFLKEDEYKVLLDTYTEEDFLYAKKLSNKITKEIFGNKIFIRALIEFTNYCKNNCYYCGIQNSNQNITRYRLGKEEILRCCTTSVNLGFKTFVLQGGEDIFFTESIMIDIIKTIRETYPMCAITLSIGEKEESEYRAYYNAGANRFLLRHETADFVHYNKIHPTNLSLENRINCLYKLKEIGYTIGAGFMVGSPFQTIESIVKDLIFLQKLRPHMIGVGPFIPHKDTVFKDQPSGNLELTLFIISLLRIMLKNVLLPATTALASLSKYGRIKGILHGANVIMPNLTPQEKRKQYMLYNDKLSDGTEAGENIKELIEELNSIGYEISYERGDWKNGNNK
ncbi:[FeFe] hydrogenase H-cluster radical SAM maturase HydE [Fusobacterium sp. PH5-44]|uniref:[FeFe] hydrogenase H-cluster radical SAM maturase HydE n=1 Tax=unclassified Fusobacterium TaxID=2648384 RepID=UPI003D1DE437